jgi:hypothetical protein
MTRTTITAVRAVIPSSPVVSDGDIQTAIATATGLVDNLSKAPCGRRLTDDCLTEIERNLAAREVATVITGIPVAAKVYR